MRRARRAYSCRPRRCAISDGKKIVFIAYNGKAVAREIHVTSQRSDGALVDGLVGGENVITTAPATLKDGDKIKIKGQS